VRLERLDQLKNAMTSSGIEAGDVPACNTVPKPIMLHFVLVLVQEHNVQFPVNMPYCTSHYFPSLNVTTALLTSKVDITAKLAMLRIES
jgi:hypothetical protein